MAFPVGSDGKESSFNVGDLGSIPGSGRSPGEGNGNPLQYSCLENSMDREAWWVPVHGVTKSLTWLSNWHFHFWVKLYFMKWNQLIYIIIFYSFFKKLFKLGLFSCFVQSAKQRKTGFLFAQWHLYEPQFLNTKIFNNNFSVTDQSKTLLLPRTQ